MPVHLRAKPGDYAEACLLPGDPDRARYIAETHLEGAVERSALRGLLGYTGEFEGRPVSVQATGMGAPSSAIVIEELIELGVRRLVRVGTCGALQPGLEPGELVLALAAVPADGVTAEYVGREAHCPVADWELVHGSVHAAKELGETLHVGAVATADTFYDPDPGRNERWASRGVLAVEMEASALFTIAALRGARAACLLVVSNDALGGGAWLSDDDLRAAVDRMTRIALKSLGEERGR